MFHVFFFSILVQWTPMDSYFSVGVFVYLYKNFYYYELKEDKG